MTCVLQKHRVVTFEGLQYPRPEDDDSMYISEATARLDVVGYYFHRDSPMSLSIETGRMRFEIYRDGRHAYEGLEYRFIPDTLERHAVGDPQAWNSFYTVKKVDVADLCVEYGRMTQIEHRQLLTEGKKAEAEADVRAKEQTVVSLRKAAYAAAFALEQSADEADGPDGLCAHWRQQEHSYILALEALDIARIELGKYTTKET